jgi:hypothetical protein
MKHKIKRRKQINIRKENNTYLLFIYMEINIKMQNRKLMTNEIKSWFFEKINIIDKFLAH